MGSKVFLFFSTLFSKLCVWFDESLIGRNYNKFCAWCYRIFEGSIIGRFFMGDLETNGIFRTSVVGRIFGLPETILLFLRKKLSKPLMGVVGSSSICRGVNSWADISIRFYGTLLISFSAICALFGNYHRAGLWLLAGLVIFAVFMIIINRSLRQLFCGSSIITAIAGLFVSIRDRERIYIPCKKTECITGIALGILLGFLCITFPLKLFVLLATGAGAFLFLLKYLRFGVFLTVVFSSILPTMALVGLSFLCAFVFCIHVIIDERITFVKNPLNTFVIFFVLALVWGCVNSFHVATSISQAAVHISFILFYFIVINTIRTRKQWLMMIKLFLLSAFAVAAYGVLQNFMGINSTESWLDEEMFEDIKVRVYSFFNNPNVLGEFLVLTIPLSLAVIWGKIRDEHKAVFGVMFIFMAACMIFTWSRGAWLGMVFACALFFVIMDRRWALLGVIILMFIPILLVATGNTAIINRLLSIGNTQDTSTAYRVSIWNASANMISDFWVSGIGIGSEAFKTIYPVYSMAGADFALHSHNLYLQVWVEMGVVGIGSLIAMMLMFIRQTFSKKIAAVRKKDPAAKIVIALGAGVLGFLLQGMTDYVWYNYKILMIFWIVIALGISGVNVVMSQPEHEEASVK